jgi:hypothetical protein
VRSDGRGVKQEEMEMEERIEEKEEMDEMEEDERRRTVGASDDTVDSTRVMDTEVNMRTFFTLHVPDVEQSLVDGNGLDSGVANTGFEPRPRHEQPLVR